MINFYNEKVSAVLEIIKDCKDCADVYNDIRMINSYKQEVQNGRRISEAISFDSFLRTKYPVIDLKLNTANAMKINQTVFSQNTEAAILSNLTQDYYGILCDTALKKQLISEIKEFIKSVY